MLLLCFEDGNHTAVAEQHQLVVLDRVTVGSSEDLHKLVLTLLVGAHSLGRTHTANRDFAILAAEITEVTVAIVLTVHATLRDDKGVTLGLVGDGGIGAVDVECNGFPGGAGQFGVGRFTFAAGAARGSHNYGRSHNENVFEVHNVGLFFV